ncbi:carbohydrate-binding protein [Luteimicrobium subarcticum]|uniref:Carbohydrate binding protein n=1 Tax=Luteimicrobium subarcticum TaxID=620910 RepID=A0A2M8W1U7_9MICO|nr:carbohydrate-binding protein [Luteimicrobium subarcticum]PJI84897.1 carbohydrate binding protein [Luteimicrobium subarcticum]
MHTPAHRALATLALAATAGALTVALPAAAQAATTPASTTAPATSSIRITEWMYKPGVTAGEFVELTNVGATPVDLAGWSYAASGGGAGQVPLASLGTVASGRSVLLTETTADTFRTQWGLAADVPVLGGITHNIGRADDVEVYDATGTLVDRLAYDDQGTGTLKGPRTQAVSGEPKTAAALGADDASQWQLAAVGDGDHAWAATVGAASDVGSPGTSRFGDARDPRASGGTGGGTGGTTLACEPEAPSGTGTLPATALAPTSWPGSADVALADAQCAWKTTTGPEGRDVSGLAFDPSDPSVLYAVKNKSWVFRLVQHDGLWVPDTSDGWGAGKEIFFPGSSDPATNQPDTEGLTVGGDGALYVTTERNNAANTVPLNSVLRFDPTQAGSTLVATDQWNLTSEFPELHAGNKTEANLGFEGVAFVPDSYLTANGFVDASTGRTYHPADYPGHGTGLYFAGLENDGKLYAYALGAGGSYHRVAVVDTGMGHVMDVQFDAGTQRIWALCDNTCGVTSTVLKVGATGAIVPDVAYAKPAGLPVDNLEGFALAPTSTCTDGTRAVLWSDDGIYGTGPGSAGEGHALYSGRIRCDLGLGDQGVPRPAAWVATKVYVAGDRVSSGGAVFEALWWTSGEQPGRPYGAWAEIATASDGTAAWTPSRVFTGGDVVVYQGRRYTAQWWTRNQVPGTLYGPWVLAG